MSLPRLCAWLALTVFTAGWASASELPDSQQSESVTGVRPFYLEWWTQSPKPQRKEFTILYPLFFYRDYADTYQWSILDLIVHYGRKDGAPPTPETEPQTFDIWPLYFSRNTGDPATTYHALLPFGGTIQDKLFYVELKFVLFPLYLQSKRHDAVTSWTPWPFIRSTHGAETGFAIWPLFGWKVHPGEFNTHFYLWPLGWNDVNEALPDAPPGTGPTHQFGALPFYASTRSSDVQARNYFWPFFGWTDRKAPYVYHETRYFYPFLVQGRGEDHYRNRWGPFYTHSIIKDVDKVWAPWPLYHHLSWQDGDIAQNKTNIAFFLYLKQEQRKISNPRAAPAMKVHYWPFLSYWDNGNGLRQWQVLSPIEVFFPANAEMRESYSPLFALYRHELQPSGDTRSSLFWGAIKWSKIAGDSSVKFFALEIPRRPSKTKALARASACGPAESLAKAGS